MAEVGCLKDGHFQNLEVAGKVIGNFGGKLLAAGTSHVLTAEESGKTIVFTSADATTITLPAPKIGLIYRFITSVTATSDHVIKTATNDHGFVGGVRYTNTTADNQDGFFADVDGSNDHITMNGSTTGGIAGSHWTIVGVADASAAGCWVASGDMIGSGNTITCFGDAQL